jgi:hypothetical protein
MRSMMKVQWFGWACAWILMVIMLVGCGEMVQFNVLRPAKVNVKQFAGGKDATVSVGSWTATDPTAQAAANEIGQYLREAITNAPAGAVKFATSGGAVTLNGTVMEHGFTEHVTEKADTCSRDEGKQKVDYSCVHRTRSGQAKLRVSMNVIDASGKTVAAESVPLQASQETDATDADPPAIDWEAILLAFRQQAAAKLARNVVPFSVIVAKPWFSCGDANETCKGGLVQLRQGNFEAALALFIQAEEKLKAMPKPDTSAQAAVYWAMTLSKEFSGDYAAADAMLKKAIALNPTEEAYAAEGMSIRQERSNAEKLKGQVEEK